jgi:Phosphoenolpyruvate synthase/pyruvate phosphate dikinase
MSFTARPEVLVCGAGVAGPVVAWWLHRYGFRVTVVERTPEHRRGIGGHAVDLFEPAVAVLDRMGLAGRVEEARTRIERISVERPGHRAVSVDFGALSAWVSDGRHIEVMRGELAGIVLAAAEAEVEHRFGDAVRTLRQDAGGVLVEFDSGRTRRFDLVVGADGLHSGVRRLVFGPEHLFAHHLGGYLAAFTLPDHRGLPGHMVVHPEVDRLVGVYPVWQTGQARAVVLFRTREPVRFDHRDVAQQRALLRTVFADAGWEVPRLLDAADSAEDFYLDEISQIRMDAWSRGRVALVGDAAYAPGPAVGGGTTLAVVGAYVLATALAEAAGQPGAAFGAYEREIGDYVRRSRALAPALMRSLVPRSVWDIRALVAFAHAVPRLPSGLLRRITAAQSGPARTMASFAPPAPAAPLPVPAAEPVSDRPPAVVALSDAAEHRDVIGGKAAGLAELIAAGERVPPGFCVTTVAHDAVREAGALPDQLRKEIVTAYERLGGGAVAVRSSATAEDLPHASFAGQHDTVLDVRGADAVIEAVQRCWASLTGERAVAYRAADGIGEGIDDATVRMAVVVQRMIEPAAAGVLFTANPITGARGEMVVDATAGRGDAVVDGTVRADHYVLDGPAPVSDGGCLSSAQLAQLWAVGERLQRRSGSPRDVEFAFARDGVLWLLQSRPVTTLFPLPRTTPADLRVYLECGNLQGMLRPFTPMGMAGMRAAAAHLIRALGMSADPVTQTRGLVEAAGRMYLDITPFVRSAVVRPRLLEGMRTYGPRVTDALARVLDDPRLAPVRGLPFRVRTVLRVGARLAPGLIAGFVAAVIAPGRTRRRAFAVADEIRLAGEAPLDARTAADHVRRAAETQAPFVERSPAMLAPLYAAMAAHALAARLLRGVAAEGEVDETLRGMPYNVTTEMDLALWRVAEAAAPHRELLLGTAPAELAARYCAGELPDIGLAAFLREYGHRGVAEVDVGVERWAEDPTAVFAALAGYLRLDDPEQAPDRRFAAAADAAVAKIDELVARARPTRPLRARLAGLLLRRSRELAGLRELPKSVWLHSIRRMRTHLLAAGAELHGRGLLDRPEDVMFLDLREALAAAEGTDLRALVERRRAEYEREMRRRTVPVLMLSDGTVPEALVPRGPVPAGALVGMAAAPGRATGRARVVLDPAGARVEPGEVLVAPTTDPGWTPLFMTAAGLVTETGAPMAHGPTVAREYGIPAVICVRDATKVISTGQVITVDGAAGTVVVEEGSSG